MKVLNELLRWMPGPLVVLSLYFCCGSCVADDGVVLLSGATVTGSVSVSGDKVTVETTSGSRTITRNYPKSRLRSYTVEGVTYNARSGEVITSGAAPAGTGDVTRSPREVVTLISGEGASPPDWINQVPFTIPRTLDLSWPQPPQGPWDSSRNIGQYIWDRVNPNPSRWREGVILMHHVMQNSSDPEVQKRAMRTLGGMYHNLHQDYPRSAYWLLQSGLEKELRQYPQAGVQLADCYLKMGCRELAVDLLSRMTSKPYSAIKLLGDLGETQQAIKLAEQFARTGEASTSWLYAGDACRMAGRMQEAEYYYTLALEAAGNAKDADKPHRQRDKARAQASLDAVDFLRLTPTDVKDGTYTAVSRGYEGDVKVEAVVAEKRLVSVRVTEHREKQFYSSITDTPARILARQSVAGIDATTGATITSEAIINATAKAMSKGLDESAEE
ncbi:MAG: FMN-binding protein [Planctomycetaceae bacterium]|nr:FMN-binding protein [Planctomycetaceae bacterium]